MLYNDVGFWLILSDTKTPFSVYDTQLGRRECVVTLGDETRGDENVLRLTFLTLFEKFIGVKMKNKLFEGIFEMIK